MPTKTVSPETPETTVSTTPVSPQRKKKNSKYVELKCMGLLTLGFFGGVLLYTLMPEGSLRGMSVGVFGCAITYCLFRFGLC